MYAKIDTEMAQFYQDKVVLVTGGTGSIGRKIVRELVNYSPKKIIVFSKDDSKQYLMKQAFKQFHHIYYLIGDIRDYQRIEYVTRGVDYIFHTAALKQVPTCEENPDEAIKTNVLGSINVIEAAIKNNVKKVINISTDKAVNPVNTMGATKLLTEKLFKQANMKLNNNQTKFCSVRFGNVIGSRGSVIPLLYEQLITGKALTITDMNMTRFFMSVEEAVQLTVKAGYYTEGGETYILKMKALKLEDLVKALMEFAKKHQLKKPKVQVIGARPGEKIYEELAFEFELAQIYETEDMYVISNNELPKNKFRKTSLMNYRSDQVNPIQQHEMLMIIEELNQS
ncbi:SDR family NAD(P)-dependent oxidoreductase [Metabacillus iocasae]|uniref:FlaA1/EpsC-like NDP-sugar epimerase n=1 Tax=Priestia iocasae TaxID=2291674 RepID=A0ABS2QX20_9BACI|nr:SDR family NAD(P)-dependent oxidoreductase [Metabacillus iocasae]MBM7703024.1 FlaA1/EpsC-like NDP-sugar epimerase [Metabacillus iocasae]